MGVFDTLGQAICGFCAEKYSSTFETLAEVGTSIAEISHTNDGINATIWGTLKNVVETTIDGLMPFGYALCVLFFMISLIELAMSERMTLEFFVKYLSKLVIGVCAVYYSQYIYEHVFGLGNALTTLMGNLFTISSSGQTIAEQMESLGIDAQSLTEQFQSIMGDDGANGWIGLLMSTVSMIIPLNLAALVLKIVAYVVGFTRILEMSIRACFLPVACALISDDGWRGAGGRYIRKFIAICAQGGVLVCIGNITTKLMIGVTAESFNTLAYGSFDEVLKTFTQTIVVIFGFGIASISLMFKSIGIVNDVFGG